MGAAVVVDEVAAAPPAETLVEVDVPVLALGLGEDLPPALPTR